MIWGLKTVAFFDIWTVEHLLSGISIGSFSMYLNKKKIKNEFKIDKELDKKLELWKETFMAILLKYYKKYKDEGICEPPEVKQETEKYQKQNDLFSEFIDEMIEEEISPETFLKETDCYAAFKIWFKTANEGQRLPSKKEFITNMESDKRPFGKCKKFKGRGAKGWENIKLVDNDDDEDEDPLLDTN